MSWRNPSICAAKMLNFAMDTKTQNPKPEKPYLDAFDRTLLDLLQVDCSRPLRELAELTHLSESSVRRRIERLRQTGVIARQIALLNPELVDGVMAIVSVSFGKETAATYRAFKARMRELPEVLQCYAVAGGNDFVVIARAPSLAEFEQFHERELMSNPAIQRSESQVIWSTVKFSTAVSL
jgi:Lrp/AsnC family transcriptional regulator, leucine-responsive regulatory protein